MTNVTDDKPEWAVQYKGAVGQHFEIAVINKDNSHGRISYGWGCENKIILFKSGVGGNLLNPINLEFALRAAQILCDGMNKEN